MRSIFWSETAKLDYWKNIDYLLENWTTTEAKYFIEQVDEFLQLLENGNLEFEPTHYKNVFRLVISKQITLFYRINQNQIELLRFWNNYQNPKKLKL